MNFRPSVLLLSLLATASQAQVWSVPDGYRPQLSQGVICGVHAYSEDGNNVQNVFTWTPGQGFTSPDRFTPEYGYASCTVTGADQAGRIYGAMGVQGYAQRAFLWSPGSPLMELTEGAASRYDLAPHIHPSGLASTTGNGIQFVTVDGVRRALNSFDPDFSYATASFSDSGLLIGRYTSPLGFQRPMIVDPRSNAVTKIPLPDGLDTDWNVRATPIPGGTTVEIDATKDDGDVLLHRVFLYNSTDGYRELASDPQPLALGQDQMGNVFGHGYFKDPQYVKPDGVYAGWWPKTDFVALGSLALTTNAFTEPPSSIVRNVQPSGRVYGVWNLDRDTSNPHQRAYVWTNSTGMNFFDGVTGPYAISCNSELEDVDAGDRALIMMDGDNGTGPGGYFAVYIPSVGVKRFLDRADDNAENCYYQWTTAGFAYPIAREHFANPGDWIPSIWDVSHGARPASILLSDDQWDVHEIVQIADGWMTGWGTKDGVYQRFIAKTPLSMSAQIELGNASHPDGVPIHVRVLDPATGDPIFEDDVNLDGSGALFDFLPFEIQDGVYDVNFKGPTWLSHTVRGVSFSKGTCDAIHIKLVNGDVNGDNTVNINDYAFISDAFNSVLGDEDYFAAADLDQNGAVNINDYAILSDNFGLYGD